MPMLPQDENIEILDLISKLANYRNYVILLQRKIVGERLVRQIARQIHQSHDLDNILDQTVYELRQFLGVSRVIIYKFKADWTGVVVCESVGIDVTSLLNRVLVDHQFIAEYLELYRHGRLQATSDIYEGGLSQCYIEWLENLEVRANLVIPIVKEGELWGLLAAQNAHKPRTWEAWEIDLIRDVSLHLSIALKQNELYRELEIANRELQELAFQDELTQVGNFRYFQNVIHQEWQRGIREKQPLSLIICDVDYFKQYNDTYGHPAGDECLKQVARCIAQGARRPGDSVCRYGGEEFVFILPNTDAGGGVYVAGQIRSRLRQSKITHEKSSVSNYVTLSFGVASCIPKLEQNFQQLLKEADEALFQAKKQGRDRIVLADNN